MNTINFEELNRCKYAEQLQLRYNLFLINSFVKLTVGAIVITVLATDIIRYLMR